MDWNDETIARLRALWDEGHSTAEIGRRMGVTKNAVVGKAHRLELPARPSPIRRVSEPGHVARRDQVRRVTGPTLPPPASVAAPVLPPLPVIKPATSALPAAPPVAERPLPESRPEPRPELRPVTPRPSARISACCWPIGEPGTSTFRFCDAGALPGKPYCAEHAALAYVKVRDRREDAA